MDANSLIDAAVPTPFGWVITTQPEFDLQAILAFQKQLLSLHQACAAPVAQAVPETVNA